MLGVINIKKEWFNFSSAIVISQIKNEIALKNFPRESQGFQILALKINRLNEAISASFTNMKIKLSKGKFPI